MMCDNTCSRLKPGISINATTSRGFTLTELIITLAIASILVATAVPSLSSFIQNSRLRSSMYDMVDAIQLARSEAVKRNQPTVICRSADPTAATPTCGGTSNTYTTGWLIFVDENDNGSYASADDSLLGIGLTADAGVIIKTNGVFNNRLTYKTDATLNETGNALVGICDDRGVGYGYYITVALVGRASIQKGTTDEPIPSCL